MCMCVYMCVSVCKCVCVCECVCAPKIGGQETSVLNKSKLSKTNVWLFSINAT